MNPNNKYLSCKIKLFTKLNNDLANESMVTPVKSCGCCVCRSTFYCWMSFYVFLHECVTSAGLYIYFTLHYIVFVIYTFVSCSLIELRRLKCLNLRENDFTEGLPSVIEKLTSLEILHLVECHLKDLPEGWV